MSQQEKPQPPSPEVVNALRSVVEEEHPGWSLVEATAERYRAERSGTQVAQVAAASPDGLVRSLLSFEQREQESNPNWTPVGPMIVTGPVDIDQDDDEDEEGE
jgi:hypothetical protein